MGVPILGDGTWQLIEQGYSGRTDRMILPHGEIWRTQVWDDNGIAVSMVFVPDCNLAEGY